MSHGYERLEANLAAEALREQEERMFGAPLPTESERIAQWAYDKGRDEPDRAWLCSPYDTWERNPYYAGPPVPHPDDDAFGDEVPF